MIRCATTADIVALVALAAAMAAESPRFARLPFDRLKVERLALALIVSADGLALVAERDGEIIGGMLGQVHEHFASSARVATDYGLFVKPDRRGGLVAIQLLERYAAWAVASGAVIVEAGISTGVHLDATTKLYGVARFAPVGLLLEYQGETCAQP